VALRSGFVGVGRDRLASVWATARTSTWYVDLVRHDLLETEYATRWPAFTPGPP
jgi:hypothetical protein